MSKQRRTRYQAHGLVKRGRPVEDMHVMAYSREGAEKLLQANGYEYKAVVPYAAVVRKMARENGSYRINQRAVNDAIQFLGIKLPVRIRYSSKVGGTRGNHLPQKSGGRIQGPAFHNIMLKSYLDAEQASKTLWHELAHAMQFEREAVAAGIRMTDPQARVHWYEVKQKDRGIGYRNKSYEVEAREYETFAATDPLAVKA